MAAGTIAATPANVSNDLTWVGGNHHRMPRIGLWLDTTQLTEAETVDTIFDRLDEALIDS